MAKTVDDVKKIAAIIEEDDTDTIRELSAHIKIGFKQVHIIIWQELNLQKVCARWIPHTLTAEQKQACIEACTQNLARF